MDKIKYALKGVSIEQFATIFEPQKDNSALNLTVPIRTNYASHTLGVGANIQFLEDEKPFLVAEVFCHFEIGSDSWRELSSDNTKDVVLPKNFVRMLVAIAISTCRGVLSAKTENTAFAKYLVPLVELGSDAGEDMVIRVE